MFEGTLHWWNSIKRKGPKTSTACVQGYGSLRNRWSLTLHSDRSDRHSLSDYAEIGIIFSLTQLILLCGNRPCVILSLYVKISKGPYVHLKVLQYRIAPLVSLPSAADGVRLSWPQTAQSQARARFFQPWPHSCLWSQTLTWVNLDIMVLASRAFGCLFGHPNH